MSSRITSELEDTKTKSIKTRPNVISTALYKKIDEDYHSSV